MDKFNQYLELSGCSNKTYSFLVKQFIDEVGIDNITEENINSFLLKKKETDSPATLNLYINAIKHLLKFLNKDIKVPKTFKEDEKIPDSFTLEYLEKNIIPVVESIFENSLKIKTLFYFLFYTGLRKSELLTLKRKDFDLEKRIAKIYQRKTKNEKIIVFPDKVSKLLEGYFAIEPETFNAFNLGKNTLDYYLNQLKRYFPEIKLRPHLFRHSFATHLLKSGVDIQSVSKLLGHKNLQTTIKYLNTNIDFLKEVYDKHIK